jgi:cytochrome P450
MIFKIATGTKNDAIASYYNILINDNKNTLNENENEKLKEAKKFIDSGETYLEGMFYFFAFNKFTRNNVPFIREKVKKLLKNKDYLFDKVYTIIKERRIEIENTPLDQPLGQDMLTSYITANTPRDINGVKNADPDLLRPMNDKEIFGNILDALLGGTDTVSKKLFNIMYFKNFIAFFLKKKKKFRFFF